MKGLFAKKSLHDLHEEASNKKEGLKRTLTGWNLITLGIGAIIGAGIFVLTGQAASGFAGPGVTISFVFATILCILAAFCYAEFASLIPIAGGPYSYAYATLGEIAAWTIGWVLTLEYLFSAATVAVGWSAYFNSFIHDFGLILPKQISQAPFLYDEVKGWFLSGSFINLPAVLIFGFIGGMIALGINVAAKFNNFVVILKLSVIALFVICGLFYINTANWVPFIPENTGTFGIFGWSGVLRGAGVIFFSFIGFDAISTLAQEARDPQKDMPIGMIGSLVVSAIVYILIALVLTGVISYKKLGGDAPFSDAINAFGPNFLWLRYLANFGILVGLSSVVLVMLLGQTRIFYTMAHDGLLPKIFGKVHKKYRTPFFNTLILTGIGMVICGLFPVVLLGLVVNIGTLLVFGIVCFGVLILRYKQPSLHRPFKVPLFPWIPLAGMLVCFLLMAAFPKLIWMQLIGWIFLGYIIYFTYGIKNSLIRKKQKLNK